MELTQFSLYKNGFLRSRVERMIGRTSFWKNNNKGRKELKTFLHPFPPIQDTYL